MELEIGAILEGKVTGITKFGAFVGLPGGRSGLVHISEVAYSYVSEVSEFLTVGQEVKVKVIGIDDNGRINLSIKQTLPPPPKPERNGARSGDRGGNRRFGNDRGPREDRGQGRPEGRYNNNGGAGNSRPGGPRPAPAPRSSAPKEPASFDDMLKQFMSDSESRQAQANRGDRSPRRRPRRGSGN